MNSRPAQAGPVFRSALRPHQVDGCIAAGCNLRRRTCLTDLIACVRDDLGARPLLREVQHRSGRPDGRVHDVPELRGFEVWMSDCPDFLNYAN
jgi:hypothetical protein